MTYRKQFVAKNVVDNACLDRWTIAKQNNGYGILQHVTNVSFIVLFQWHFLKFVCRKSKENWSVSIQNSKDSIQKLLPLVTFFALYASAQWLSVSLKITRSKRFLSSKYSASYLSACCMMIGTCGADSSKQTKNLQNLKSCSRCKQDANRECECVVKRDKNSKHQNKRRESQLVDSSSSTYNNNTEKNVNKDKNLENFCNFQFSNASCSKFHGSHDVQVVGCCWWTCGFWPGKWCRWQFPPANMDDQMATEEDRQAGQPSSSHFQKGRSTHQILAIYIKLFLWVGGVRMVW